MIGGALQRLPERVRRNQCRPPQIFVGQTEAPLIVRPYITNMTRSELFAIMVGGMSTVAGSALAGYVLLGVEIQYLLAPVSWPRRADFDGKTVASRSGKIASEEEEFTLEFESHVNVIDAAASGASSGMSLALNVGAMVLAFVGLIALVNTLLGSLGAMIGFADLSLQLLLGYAFQPLAFIVGIPWRKPDWREV